MAPSVDIDNTGADLDNHRTSERQRRVRDPPLIEPTIETFPLAAIPKLLERLHVPVNAELKEVHLQYSVHSCPRRIKREMKLVFPELAGQEDKVLIIPTFQKTASAMIGYDADSQVEKDTKLHLFYRWGAAFVECIRKEGYWADITDPMSGMALFTTCGPSPFPDAESSEILLRYQLFNVGSCFIATHPSWGTHVYPATAFTLAPIEVVARVIDSLRSTTPTQ